MIASGMWKPLNTEVPSSCDDHLNGGILKDSRKININVYMKLGDPPYTEGNMVDYQPGGWGESKKHWNFQ